MDIFGYRRRGESEGDIPSRVIRAFASRWINFLGDHPDIARPEAYYDRDPFEMTDVKRVSVNLQTPYIGNIDGHNTMSDGNVLATLKIDRNVPISPLFARDLCGRIIYIGYGPERKTNDDWAAYRPPIAADGTVRADQYNPFIPLVVFPRFCREVREMEGADLLENVFLTRFRCLEMSTDFEARPSGSEEDDEPLAFSYSGANLYPYKLRLDTFYIDGWKLPQTQMVHVKPNPLHPGEEDKVGEEILRAWNGREAGTSYEKWLLDMGGRDQIERWYERGCTLIPTFEACNGYQVVGRDFELKDYWPGRSVIGLHVVVERRPDKAPANTILQVVAPGYVTGTKVVPAQVIVSDGSGYVSPNVADPLPLIPNFNLPHQRAVSSWYSLWIPTHPEHFEAPALWGWDLDTGRFLQFSGPLWDPLHYFYASVDEVLKAYEEPLPHEENRWLVPVPDHMRHRFYPVVPMKGFDTFSLPEYDRREENDLLPVSCLKRVDVEEITAAIGYHPMPVEFEYELDPFWFPEFHPLNRNYGLCPEYLEWRIASVIKPNVTVTRFVESVEADDEDECPWLKDTSLLMTPTQDVASNYPHLTRYLVPDIEIPLMVRLCPPVFLARMPDEAITKPVTGWWVDAEGMPLDDPLVLEDLGSGLADAVWNSRQEGALIAKFRHFVYQTNEILYLLAWWSGATVALLQMMLDDWERREAGVTEGEEEGAGEGIPEEQQNELMERIKQVRQERQIESEKAREGMESTRPVTPLPSALPEEAL